MSWKADKRCTVCYLHFSFQPSFRLIMMSAVRKHQSELHFQYFNVLAKSLTVYMNVLFAFWVYERNVWLVSVKAFEQKRSIKCDIHALSIKN